MHRCQTVPFKRSLLHPLAPFTVNWTGTPFLSGDDLLRPKKGSHPHLSAQAKHPSCKQKARGRSSPPRSSLSKRSGLERSLRRLSRDRGETELFQLGHHIVVLVETGDLPLPDLQDRTGPQFARALHAWKSSRGQIQGTGVVPTPGTLKDDLILCGKHIGQFYPQIREVLCEKQHSPLVAIWTMKRCSGGNIDDLAVCCISSYNLIEPGRV